MKLFVFFALFFSPSLWAINPFEFVPDRDRHESECLNVPEDPKDGGVCSCEHFFNNYGYGPLDYARDVVYTWTEENATPYAVSNAWYVDYDQPGVGITLSIQKSKLSSTGYFVFGAFYTYEADGSQVWYTIGEEYDFNSQVNDWREKASHYENGIPYPGEPETVGYIAFSTHFRCSPTGDDTWLADVSGRLHKTANGPVMGLSASHGYDSIEGREIRLRFRTPQKIEVYLDGSDQIKHVMRRANLTGDIEKGDADYLLEGVWHLDTVWNEALRPGLFGDDFPGALATSYIQGNLTFERFDPSIILDNPDIWDWVKTRFIASTEINEHKHYYISTQRVAGNLLFWKDISVSNQQYDLFNTFGAPSGNEYEGIRILMVYDDETGMIAQYFFSGINQYEYVDPWQDSAVLGMHFVELNGRFKGYLPPADQGRISMYLARCTLCGQSGTQGKKELRRRAGSHLWRIPSNGEEFLQMPQVWRWGKNVDNPNYTSGGGQ